MERSLLSLSDRISDGTRLVQASSLFSIIATYLTQGLYRKCADIKTEGAIQKPPASSGAPWLPIGQSTFTLDFSCRSRIGTCDPRLESILCNNSPLLDALNRVGCGCLLLTTEGEIDAINDTARRILQQELELRELTVDDLIAYGRRLIKQLLARAQGRLRIDNEDWVIINRDLRRPLVLQAMSIYASGSVDLHTALIILDLDDVIGPNSGKLEQIFSLTPAESRLASSLTKGFTPAEAAQIHKISMATVRSQLRSIYSKTQTRRQAELVALVARLSVLP